jgi:hypothetical protein
MKTSGKAGRQPSDCHLQKLQAADGEDIHLAYYGKSAAQINERRHICIPGSAARARLAVYAAPIPQRNLAGPLFAADPLALEQLVVMLDENAVGPQSLPARAGQQWDKNQQWPK